MITTYMTVRGLIERLSQENPEHLVFHDSTHGLVVRSSVELSATRVRVADDPPVERHPGDLVIIREAPIGLRLQDRFIGKSGVFQGWTAAGDARVRVAGSPTEDWELIPAASLEFVAPEPVAPTEAATEVVPEAELEAAA